MFLSSLAVGSLMTVSSYSWFGMWMGMEINLLSFIPLISSTKNPLSSESAMKYFLAQSLASMILLFSMITIVVEFMNSKLGLPNQFTIMNAAIMMKMGAAPFHFWFPETIEGMSWINSLILLSWQKIAPMTIFSYTVKMSSIIHLAIVSSMLVSGIMGINQTSLRKILTYSSINHIGWMMSSMLFWETTWLVYFIIYCLITFNIVIIFNNYNIFHISQLINITKSKSLMISFSMNFLSLGGIPPFIGFFPKWITINELVKNNSAALATFMILSTLITTYFYMRMIMAPMTLNQQELPTTEIKLNMHNLALMNFVTLFGLIGLIALFIQL